MEQLVCCTCTRSHTLPYLMLALSLGMAPSAPNLPEKGGYGSSFCPPSTNLATTRPLMPWTNQTFGGCEPTMGQDFLPNDSAWRQQVPENCRTFSTMSDFCPKPKSPGTSQSPSSQQTSKTPASKPKLPRLRACATRPLHKRSPSLKALSMTKRTRFVLEDSGNANSGSNSNISKALEDIQLEDAIELLKKKFQRSPFLPNLKEIQL